MVILPLASSLLLTCNPTSFGYDSAFIGVTIARAAFKNDFGIVGSEADNISSNITSTFQAGAFFGALFCFFCKLGNFTVYGDRNARQAEN